MGEKEYKRLGEGRLQKPSVKPKTSHHKLTQAEIDQAKTEYFKQGGTITNLTHHEWETQTENRKLKNSWRKK